MENNTHSTLYVNVINPFCGINFILYFDYLHSTLHPVRTTVDIDIFIEFSVIGSVIRKRSEWAKYYFFFR